MNKTILITGTSTGIGRATARFFAGKGWNVAATMRSQADIAAETEFIKMPNVACFVLDVTDDATIQSAIAETVKRFGKIDVLVNNAGYGADGIFEDMTDDVIQRQFNTNVFGLMRVTRAIIPHMRQNKGGTIVQIASMGGRVTFPLFSIYHATKWAVEGFSESLHYELRQFGIKIKIIEPGTIKTEFYGKGRVAVAGKSLAHYKELVDKCEKVSQAPAQNGITPVEVAKVIYDSVDSGWKMRFAAGSPAPMLLALRMLVPDSWFFAMVRNSYKI